MPDLSDNSHPSNRTNPGRSLRRFTELALRVRMVRDRIRATGRQPAPTSPDALDLTEFSAFVIRLARMVHCGRPVFAPDDAVIDEFTYSAPGWIMDRLDRFRPALGSGDPFVPWTRRCLERCYAELGRTRRRDRNRMHRHDRPDNLDLDPSLEDVATDGRSAAVKMPEQAPFEVTEADLARCEGLDPVDLVIVFSVSDKWHLVPPKTWAGWLAASNLPASFPPPPFVEAAPAERKKMLASLLGASGRDFVYQRLHRLRRRVASRPKRDAGEQPARAARAACRRAWQAEGAWRSDSESRQIGRHPGV